MKAQMQIFQAQKAYGVQVIDQMSQEAILQFLESKYGMKRRFSKKTAAVKAVEAIQETDSVMKVKPAFWNEEFHLFLKELSKSHTPEIDHDEVFAELEREYGFKFS